MRRTLPRLYAILDAELLDRLGLELLDVAALYRSAGVLLLQYRDKVHRDADILHKARKLRDVFAGSNCTLLLNDWPELAARAEWDGVHVGQGDIAVQDARRIVGESRWVGVSTHTLQQVQDAQQSSADYIAIGPVYATRTKTDPDPTVGLEGVRAARRETEKPLVAIGGIRLAEARGVMEAGADSVAVISDLLSDPFAIGGTVTRFLQELR